MAFCTECGHRLPEGARHCPICGHQVEPATPKREQSSSRSGSLLGSLAEQLRAEIAEDLQTPGLAAEVGSEMREGVGEKFSISPPPSRGGGMRGRELRFHQGLLPRLKLATVFVLVGEVNPDGIFTPGRSGSGFAITPDGLIITNRHVVQDNSQVLVVFNCGSPAAVAQPAEVALAELPVDLALLRVEAPDHLPVLRLADSNQVVETDRAWALGYPLGVNLEVILNQAGYQLNENGPEVSVREGTITAVRHDSDGRVKLLEHNCNIAPGNSGGPLVDHQGRVIGVNTLGFGGKGPAEVTNFAIPSRVVAKFVRAVGGPDDLL